MFHFCPNGKDVLYINPTARISLRSTVAFGTVIGTHVAVSDANGLDVLLANRVHLKCRNLRQNRWGEYAHTGKCFAFPDLLSENVRRVVDNPGNLQVFLPVQRLRFLQRFLVQGVGLLIALL